MYERILTPIDVSPTSERGLQHALIGSDAERVVRLSPVPVLLIREHVNP